MGIKELRQVFGLDPRKTQGCADYFDHLAVYVLPVYSFPKWETAAVGVFRDHR
jgi:hypothetical protein